MSRRLRPRADKLASEQVGKETLEGVLEKMKALGLVNVYAGGFWLGHPFTSEFMNGRPTLAERITNLDQISRATGENRKTIGPT